MAAAMMAPVLLDNNNFLACNSHTCRRDSIRSDFTMFKSLKDKLSLKNRNSSQSTRTPSIVTGNSHPQINSTSPTRRPASQLDSNNPFKGISDAPPPYSPTSDVAAAAPSATLSPRAWSPPHSTASRASKSTTGARSVPRAQTPDDPYFFLGTFDTVFLIDDSGSMNIRDGSLETDRSGHPRLRSRWEDTRIALEKIAPICAAHDSDGIDIYFLNAADSEQHHNIKDSAKVQRIFSRVRPSGGTLTGMKLEQIMKPYLRRYKATPEGTKPLNIICITDGEPSDDVEGPLIDAAKKLDKFDAPAWQLGVQFFQVGKEEQATKHLQRLDDELQEIARDDELRDIIDTVPFSSDAGTEITSDDGILKVVLGAVNRRLDRKKNVDLHQ